MLEQIIITGFLVLAIWYSLQEGEIFGFVSVTGEKYIPEKLQQPLFACNVCMSFWYGSVIYWVLWANSWQQGLIVAIGAMGFNAALNKLSPDK